MSLLRPKDGRASLEVFHPGNCAGGGLLMSWMIHVANVLVLVSFCVKEILWLRVLSVLASVFYILYFVDEQLMAPVCWNTLFSLVNLYQLGRLVLNRRLVVLTALEAHLHRNVFQDLTPREVQSLVSIAIRKQKVDGRKMVKKGEVTDHLFLITEGTVKVETGNALLSTLGSDRFFGEMSYLSRTPSQVEITSDNSLVVLVWPRRELHRFLQDRPAVHSVLQHRLGDEMIQKYRSTLGMVQPAVSSPSRWAEVSCAA